MADRDPDGKRGSRPVRNIFFSAAVLLCFAAVLEGALRLANPFFPSDLYAHPDFGIMVKPGSPHYRQNSLGFNDAKEFREQKDPGVFRIVALGDSFSWSSGGRNYWPAAEEILRKKFPGKIEVYNQGIIATGPDGYLKLLKNFSLRYSPDAVAAGIYVGNDFAEGNPEKTLVLRFGTRMYFPSRSARSFDAERDIFLWSLIKTRLRLWTNQQALKLEGRAARSGDILSKKNFLEIEKNKLGFLDPVFYDSREWDETCRRLAEMHELLRSRGIPFFAVILPEEFQIEDALWQELFKTYPYLDERAYDRYLPQKRLIPFFRERKIPYLNVLEVFQAQPPGAGPFYQPVNTHFNVKGDEVTGQAVADFLAEQIRGRIEGKEKAG